MPSYMSETLFLAVLSASSTEPCGSSSSVVGVRVTLVSPRGGQPPLDPKSDEPDAQTENTKRFKADPAAPARRTEARWSRARR